MFKTFTDVGLNINQEIDCFMKKNGRKIAYLPNCQYLCNTSEWSEESLKTIRKMTNETYKITLTREQLTFVQVALLEAQIAASEDKRIQDATRYLDTYKYIGTEKRRVLTLKSA